jgi:hypothetical protein
MKHARLALSALAFVLLCSASAFAQAPAGATGQCKDGTYTNVASKSGACAGHKGVKTWFGPAAAPKTTPKPTTTASKPTPPAPAPAPAPASKPSLLSKLTSKSTTPASSSPTPAPAPAPKPAPAASSGGAPAAGGGPGMVWVNSSTKVYHCPTDRYYGKTKNGKYVTESAAQAEGDKPDAGKKCF